MNTKAQIDIAKIVAIQKLIILTHGQIMSAQ